MYSVYEVFSDGKQYWMYSHNDRFECIVWACNHSTTASSKVRSELKVVEEVEG